MRASRLLLLSVVLLFVASAAWAQTGGNGGNDVSWSALNPGNDWAAQAIQSVFPINGAGPTATGNEATVIGKIVGQLTGFVTAIAMAFVCYNTIVNIHRVAETANLFSRGMTSLFLVRIGFAAIMMFPLSSGFSTGQAAVEQAAMWGIGMAKSVYQNAVQAIGPDAVAIAVPEVPGTKTIVLNLMEDELCRALVNAAAANPNLMPVPTPIESAPGAGQPGGYITWSYSLSPGNETGSPTCGTITIQEPSSNAATIAGVSVDMTGQQQTILTNVLQNDIQPTVDAVATNFWQTKQAAALAPLQTVLQTATADYTQQLTQAASDKTSAVRSALQASELRAGNVGLISNETQLSSLGWTSAGAYYLEFARLNGTMLSLLSATPTANPPSYDGLSPSLAQDLMPLVQAGSAFLTKLGTYVQTTDGIDTPGGNADLFSGATPGEDGAGAIEKLFRSLHITETVLHFFTDQMSPTGNQWTDPFSGLMQLGHKMIMTAMVALGAAGLLASTTGSGATALASLFSGNVAAAAGAIGGHLLMQFFATPVFLGCMALLIPGLTIAFVLPMIPWVMWMAGVAGYLILVCEAIVAVPLWMLAHMTFEGAGLHGRATEGYSLLFNVLFRPVLMLLGLFLGYFVFDAMSWLIRESFGIAAGFVLQNGWLVTNVLGVMVLLGIYVMTHIVAALTSFRMISLVPHHLPRLVGFMAANRVDMDRFSRDAALVGLDGTLGTINRSVRPDPAGQPALKTVNSPSSGRRALAAPAEGMDSTIRASTDDAPPSIGGSDA